MKVFPECLNEQLPAEIAESDMYALISEVRNAANAFYISNGWDWNDAQVREWESQYDVWLFRVFAIPVVGATFPARIPSQENSVVIAETDILFTQGDYYFFAVVTAICGMIMGMGLGSLLWGALCQ